MSQKQISLFPLICLLVLGICMQLWSRELPQVRILSVNRVFYNGEHNAFTDLCRYNGSYYLTFRSCPDGHGIHPTSSIIVLTSVDSKVWQESFRFHVPERDTRDPHFLIFKDKLFVYTGTWYCGQYSEPDKYNINQHLGYAVWTEDGDKWQGPQLLEGSYGHYVWRAAKYRDKAYLCARRIHDFLEFSSRSSAREIMESAMLESDDGLVWKKVTLFQERNGDETAFLFEQNGAIIAVSRRDRGNAELCRAEKPYQNWQRYDLGLYIGGPLLVNWHDRYLVGGRKAENETYRTALYWLEGNELFQCAELPSDGDNSYPGFIELSADRALLSYYSSHERDDAGNTITAIYLAELKLEQ
jgi:hypothetical protein